MPGRTRALIAALAVLAVASLLLHLLPREDAATERTLISSTGVRSVIDLLQVPASARISLAGSDLDLPGPAGRWLACTLDQGTLRVGWLDDPAAEAELAGITMPAPGAVRVAAWPMRQDADAVGIELAHGWTPDARRIVGRIDILPP